MGTRIHNAYMGFIDRLFDASIEPGIIGDAAYWLLVHLPETKSERESYERLFGYDGNPLVFPLHERIARKLFG